MTRSRLLASTTALLTLAFVGTGSQLSYYEEALPTTMNPLFARTMVDRRAHELVFDRLYYRSAVTAEIKSRLIESETRLDDGAGIQLTVRDGIKWHDGKPLLASDICFTIDVLLNPDTPSQMAKPYREDLLSCEADDATRKATVRFTRAFYNPTERLSFMVLPQHAFESTTILPDNEFSLRPTGTGPMKGSKGRREVRFTAVANAHHGANIGIASLAEGGDPLVQVRTLMNGGVHGLISVSPSLRSDVAATDDVALKSYDLRSWWFMAVNPRGKLADKRVRQAIHHTLDRHELRRLTMGYDPDDIVQPCQFISGPFIPQSPYYNRSVSIDERSDIGKAKQLMAEAGAVEEHGVWMLDGQPLDLRIGMAAPLDLEARDLLNQIGNQLQSGNFGRQVFKISNDDWNNKVVTGQMKDEYDLLIGKWSFGVVENVNPLFETRAGGRGSLNIFDYSDEKTDELIAAYENASTDTGAQDAYHALHAHLDEELPYIFLWKLDTKSAWRVEVRGNTITPYWYFTEFDGWSL